jgi:hypothetical protein
MCGDTICNVLQDVLKSNCVSVESETIIRVYMLILYISNNNTNNNNNRIAKIRLQIEQKIEQNGYLSYYIWGRYK